MKRILFIAAVALGLVVLSAADSIITKSVNLVPFDTIVTKGKVDIKYLPGEQGVKICGPEKAVNKFKSEVVDGVLTLDAGKITFLKNDNLVVYVSTPTLKGVRIEGAGDFEAERGLIAKELSLNISGAGDIDVKNLEAANVKISLNGAGDINVENANCETVDVVVNGAGDVEIEGIECKNLSANINGAGSADFAGHSVAANLILNGAGSIDIAKFTSENLTTKINGLGNIKRK